MKVENKYFPVGKGLTYGLKISNFHMLFDIRNKNNVMNDIGAFYTLKYVDILVISHFHKDHMDGLNLLYNDKYLLKKIYIPCIDDDEKFILRLMDHFSSKSKILKGYKACQELLDASETDLNETNKFNVIPVDNNLKIKHKTSKGDTWDINIYQSKGNAKEKVVRILGELAHLGVVTPDDVLEMLETHENQIREAYNRATKKLNLTSIFVVHGPTDEAIVDSGEFTGKEFFSNLDKSDIHDKYHSLVCGDFNLNNNLSTVKKYKDKLGFCLVPHHSGTNEWNGTLTKEIDKLKWIVTVDKVDTRPHAKVVRDIHNSSNELFVCDLENSFEYNFNLK